MYEVNTWWLTGDGDTEWLVDFIDESDTENVAAGLLQAVYHSSLPTNSVKAL